MRKIAMRSVIAGISIVLIAHAPAWRGRGEGEEDVYRPTICDCIQCAGVWWPVHTRDR